MNRIFAGPKKAESAVKAGRIPVAVNPPTSWIFEKDGCYKGKDTLESLAASVIGKERDWEIVTSCDTGTCCPAWRFMLKEVLGYKRVYLYDGSIEEWTTDHNAPVERNNTGRADRLLTLINVDLRQGR